MYIAHSMWSLAQLFRTLQCTGTPCYRSYLKSNPRLQLAIFTSPSYNPISSEVQKVVNIRNFDYRTEYHRELDVDVPLKTRRNGTLYMHVALALDDTPLDWKSLQRDGPTVIQRIALTEYMEPKAATFNLLGDQPPKAAKRSSNARDKNNNNVKPVTHLKPKAHAVILTDDISISHADLPPELAPLIRINRKNEFLPIIQNDFFKSRLNDLIEVTKDTTEAKIQFHYSPIGIGKLRLMLQIEHAMKSMLSLGFSKKDIDEVKGIFSDTNVYLLLLTVFVGSVHMLFDFLSFKNDVIFWRRKNNYAGLSVRTTLWRAFSQVVIFLYLLDEKTSLLVLVPAGIGTMIELWKCKKILKLEISWSGIRAKKEDNKKAVVQAEEKTQEFDKEAMRYLSYLLYPLCIAGAVYSLLYQPHKSWYSWTLNSLVNGVYAFGFLFMLPQLFVNYKLKSVAALPWRAFMYKAFNTFIDDLFAFIITMPTAHRVACFRDDVVFLIYLYQRYLYPVDKSRVDMGASFEDATDENAPERKVAKAAIESKKEK